MELIALLGLPLLGGEVSGSLGGFLMIQFDINSAH